MIKEEELQRHALEVSTALIAGLKALMSKHLLIGQVGHPSNALPSVLVPTLLHSYHLVLVCLGCVQVRGAGLFLGVELVTSRFVPSCDCQPEVCRRSQLSMAVYRL